MMLSFGNILFLHLDNTRMPRYTTGKMYKTAVRSSMIYNAESSAVKERHF